MRYDDRFLDEQRQFADDAADGVVADFLSSRPEALFQSLHDDFQGSIPKRLLHFLESSRPEQKWYNPISILRGQEIFKKYALEIMSLLGLYSLPYCYAGTPGNKALYLSSKMRQSPGKRLHDTAGFVLSVSTPGTFDNGTARRQINKTRLIHAIARHHLLHAQWDRRWGLPINQEDMAGTNLAFSVIILFGLQRSGVVLTQRQKDDWIRLWRHVGYQLHIDTELLPEDFAQACLLTEKIKARNFGPSEEGIILMRELIEYYRSTIPANEISHVQSQVRYFLGREVSAFVGLEEVSPIDSIVSLANSFRQLKSMLFPHTSSYEPMLTMMEKMKDANQ